MGTTHPYLQRRGHRFFFRISIPLALRRLVGAREFTSTLKTGDRAAAVPLALELAATAHRLFNDLSNPMSDDNMKDLLAKAKVKLQVDAVREQMTSEVDEAHRARIAGIHEVRRATAAEVR